jgi:hypothetical protein
MHEYYLPEKKWIFEIPFTSRCLGSSTLCNSSHSANVSPLDHITSLAEYELLPLEPSRVLSPAASGQDASAQNRIGGLLLGNLKKVQQAPEF